MKKNLLFSVLLTMIIILAAACSEKSQTDPQQNAESQQAAQIDPVELTISAAASLQDAMEEIKTQFANVEPNISLAFNYGGSGALQQQIQEGAPVDLFFSAAQDKYDLLVEAGLIDASEGKTLLGNELVLVAPVDAEVNEGDFTYMTNDAVKQIALGTPDSVPAGKYAEQVLQGLNIYDAVKDKIVFAKDVRSVLNYVETKSVDLGAVYKTDALTSDQVKILSSAPTHLHDPIVYPCGVIKDSKNKEAAMKFYNYLQGEEAKNIFVKYGFTVLN